MRECRQFFEELGNDFLGEDSVALGGVAHGADGTNAYIHCFFFLLSIFLRKNNFIVGVCSFVDGEAGDEGMPAADNFEEPQNDPLDEDLVAFAGAPHGAGANGDGAVGAGDGRSYEDDDEAEGDGWEIVPDANKKVNFETLKNKYHVRFQFNCA